jgi:hypothetical protein
MATSASTVTSEPSRPLLGTFPPAARPPARFQLVGAAGVPGCPTLEARLHGRSGPPRPSPRRGRAPEEPTSQERGARVSPRAPALSGSPPPLPARRARSPALLADQALGLFLGRGRLLRRCSPRSFGVSLKLSFPPAARRRAASRRRTGSLYLRSARIVPDLLRSLATSP